MVKGTEDGKNEVALIAAELSGFIALNFFTQIDQKGNENLLLFSNVVSKYAISFLKFKISGNECT